MIHWQIKYRDVDQLLYLKILASLCSCCFWLVVNEKKTHKCENEVFAMLQNSQNPVLVVKKKRAGDKSTPFTVSVRTHIETRGRYGPTYTTKTEYYGTPPVYVRAHHC